MEGIEVDEHEIQDDDNIGTGSPIPYGLEDASSAFGDDMDPRGEDIDVADAGQEAGDGFFDGSDSESSEYDSDEESDELLLSLEEMREAIEDEIGPGMDLEMWELRVSSCSQLSVLFLLKLPLRQLTYHRPGSHQHTSIQTQAHVKHASSHIPPDVLHIWWLYGH
jgi:hypothetical protein